MNPCAAAAGVARHSSSSASQSMNIEKQPAATIVLNEIAVMVMSKTEVTEVSGRRERRLYPGGVSTGRAVSATPLRYRTD